MSLSKKKYTTKFKFDRVLEHIGGVSTIEISRQYGVNANLISKWKKHFLDNGSEIFETTQSKEIVELRTKVAKLEQIIGKKEIELNLIRNFSDFYQSQNGR